MDVGGGCRPFERADWVIDLLPYEERSNYGEEVVSAEHERFSLATWVQRDICEHEPWPFADDQFDFVFCSHTLEDIRDPIWVCGELKRVAKAGYIEVPSRLWEQSHGFEGPWTGWDHHRWLCEVGDGRIDFTFKHHRLSGSPALYFPEGFVDTLDPELLVDWLWWEESFDFAERIIQSGQEADRFLREFVEAHLPPDLAARRAPPSRLRGFALAKIDAMRARLAP